MSNSKRCVLSSVTDSVSIDLPDGEEVVLGRSSTTEIRDLRCSRKQLTCKADYSANKVHINAIGFNPCGLNRNIVRKGETVEAVNGDVLEFVYADYMFTISFKDSTPRTTASPIVTPSSSPVAKKMKFSEDTSKENLQTKAAETDKWETISQNNLFIYTSKGVAPSSKIAAFDMDGTLICTKSGKVFPVSDDDWKLLYPQVKPKLKSLYEDGFKIVIFTNQAGIKQGRIPVPNMKRKLEEVISAMGVPAQAYISPGEGIFRKPCPGMWETLVEEKNNGVPVNKSESFYCGDAAGRVDSWAPKKKKDFSCSDRLFALNISLSFLTPEEFFLGEKPARYELPQFNPSAEVSKTLLEPSAQIPSTSPEMIVLVGAPGSGKSHFCRTHLVPAGYTSVNRDTLGSWQKCATLASAALSKNQRVVIDNTNPDLESRKRFIEIAQKASVPCRCFVMSFSEARARHNNKFRQLTEEEHVHVADIIVKMYKSKYKEPEESEGFTEIVRVNFIPKFQNAEVEKLYGMYLLDKY